MASAVLGVAIGLVYLAVSLVVFRLARASAQSFRWLLVLGVFFVVRGVDRMSETITDARPEAFAYLADVLVLMTLVLLVLGLRRTVDGLRAARDEAEWRQAAYDRALADYERLTRHRLANPIAAIRGGVATVREVETLSAVERDELLAMVEKEALRLADISLDPGRLSPEERRLHPRPRDLEFPDAA